MNQNNQPLLDQLQQLRALAPDETESRRAIERAQESIIQQPLQTQWYGGKVAMIARIAACVTLVAALGIIPLNRLWRSDGEGTLLADMVENVKKAKNVSYRFKGRAPSDEEKMRGFGQHVYRIWIDASGSYRKETTWGAIIVNRRDGSMTRIDQRMKRAWVSDIPKDEPFEGVYDYMKAMDFAKYEKLQEKIIEGRKVIGFVVPFENTAGKAIHWIDINTKLPIRIEIARERDQDQPNFSGVIDQIVFDDPKISQSLFELKVPEGYEVRRRQ
jgi:outer membrane lipoprotein-sorting protein